MYKIKRFVSANWCSTALMLLFIFCSVFIFSTGNYLYKLFEVDNKADGIFSSNTLYFKVSNADTINLTAILNDENFIAVNIIVKPNEQYLSAYEAILFNQYYSMKIQNNMKFNKVDFTNQKYKALIGSSVHEIMNVNDLVINGSKYEIKGQFDNNTYKSQNYSVIYTKGDIAHMDTSKVVGIDAKHASIVEKAYNKVQSIVENQGATIERISINQTSISKFLSYKKSVISIICFTTFLLILVLSLVTIFWLYSVKQYIAACTIIGIPSINKKLCGRFLGFFSLAFILGGLVSFAVIADFCLPLFVCVCLYAAGIFLCSLSLSIGMKYFKYKEIKTILENDYE